MKKRKLLKTNPFRKCISKSIPQLSYMWTVTINLIVLVTLFSSCGISDEKKREKKEYENKQLFASLSKQYNALMFQDTVFKPTTLYFQDMLRKGKKVIVTDLYFDDVEEKDSFYLLSVHSGLFDNKYFELVSTEANLKMLFPGFPEIHATLNNFSNENVFLIVKLFSVKKIKLSENIKNNFNESLFSDPFIFQGELIGVYSKESEK